MVFISSSLTFLVLTDSGLIIVSRIHFCLMGRVEQSNMSLFAMFIDMAIHDTRLCKFFIIVRVVSIEVAISNGHGFSSNRTEPLSHGLMVIGSKKIECFGLV